MMDKYKGACGKKLLQGLNSLCYTAYTKLAVKIKESNTEKHFNYSVVMIVIL